LPVTLALQDNEEKVVNRSIKSLILYPITVEMHRILVPPSLERLRTAGGGMGFD